jgi:hypothetical protein
VITDLKEKEFGFRQRLAGTLVHRWDGALLMTFYEDTGDGNWLI